MKLRFSQQPRTRGMSFIEVLVGAAVIALIFGGLVASFQFALILLTQTRAQTGALALANERIEYLRSLAYDSVGTVSGIPSGSIPQNEVASINGVSYNRRTLIQYVDDVADGFGGADTNGITADYKRAKVEVSWTQKGVAKSVVLVTNIIPKGMETVAGGGTLIVNVFDAGALPVSSVAVRIVNASTSPPIDVTAYTTALGQVIFPGAPTGGGYQVSVTKDGYSSAQTYSASTTNQNPNPPHVAVVVSAVSTVNFAIDEVASMAIKTVEPPSLYQNSDTFAGTSGLDLMNSTVVAGGSLVLASASGTYAASGDAYATATAPPNLISWSEARFTTNTPALTSLALQVYSVSASGTRSLIPDSDIPGNAAGFTASPIDLTAVSVGIYTRLALGVTLGTTDASSTPSVLDWLIEYEAANVPIPNIAYTISGLKSIGTDGGGQPVLKYSTTLSTNASGSSTASGLEWDTYSIAVNGATGYDISDVCPKLPISISPREATTTTLVLSPHTTRSLRVAVTTVSGMPIGGASVRLTRSGYDVTKVASVCGSAFFESLASATDYDVETTASGYQIDTINDISITGTTVLGVTLIP